MENVGKFDQKCRKWSVVFNRATLQENLVHNVGKKVIKKLDVGLYKSFYHSHYIRSRLWLMLT